MKQVLLFHYITVLWEQVGDPDGGWWGVYSRSWTSGYPSTVYGRMHLLFGTYLSIYTLQLNYSTLYMIKYNAR